MHEILIFLHFILMVLYILLISFKLTKSTRSCFLDIYFYASILTFFYILIPSFLGITFGHSLGFFSKHVYFEASMIGFYFSFILFVCYFFNRVENYNLDCLRLYRFKSSVFFIKIFASIIFIYIIFLILINFNDILNLNSRADKSNFIFFVENKYKIKALFAFQVLLVSFLSVLKRNLLYFAFMAPYVLFDLLLVNRSYIFSSFIVFFLVAAIINKPLKVRTGLFFILATLSIAVLRHPDQFQLSHLVHLLGEFINTWSTLLLTLSSYEKHSFYQSISYFVLRIFPSFIYNNFIGEYSSWAAIPAGLKTVGFGLAGSILGEVVSFRNLFIVLVFPFVFVGYLQFIKLLFYKYSVFGLLVFIISVMYLQQVFRYSFFELALYPFFVVIFYGFFLIVPSYLKAYKVR